MRRRQCPLRCGTWAIVAIAAAGAPGCQHEGQLVGRPWETITLAIKDKSLQVEVACDQDSRRLGLMDREALGADEGMLFLFPRAQELSFWMKNTPLPLSIAFLDDEGVIQEIADMKPLDESHTRSKNPGRYALEVNQGWFQKNAIAVGDKIAEFRAKIGRFLVE